VGWDSLVGIVTHYMLEGPWIEPVQTSQGGPKMGTVSFPGIKRPGRGVNHDILLVLKLTKRYSYTTLGLHGLL